MRFVAPARDAVDPRVFDAPVFAGFERWRDWLTSADWPDVATIDAALRGIDPDQRSTSLQFVEQTPALLADGLHYEQRIARDGRIATRPRNWHDLFNALVWLRFPAIKRALNARQVADIERIGSRQRSRAQCALTHFDEAGVVLLLRDRVRVAAWDRHDWPAMFAGLESDDFAIAVIGHALLEHALQPERLLCGKALVLHAAAPTAQLGSALSLIADGIAAGRLLGDPQQLRPLPLMGLPGWHPQAGDAHFLRSAECFQPLREGRRYPPPMTTRFEP